MSQEAHLVLPHGDHWENMQGLMIRESHRDGEKGQLVPRSWETKFLFVVVPEKRS